MLSKEFTWMSGAAWTGVGAAEPQRGRTSEVLQPDAH
jgi:hypothetical protein